MPCWSVLEASVNLGRVDLKLLALAAQVEGASIERVGDKLVIVVSGFRIVVGADGAVSMSSRLGVIRWGGASYDTQTDAGRASFVSAVKRSVAAVAVRMAAQRSGWSVQAAGGARAVLRRG